MHWRKIVVDDVEWQYAIGKTYVVARRPKQQKVISFAELLGLSWHEVERGIAKRWLAIRPADIASWLYEGGCQ